MNKRNRRGFTIVELMIGMFIGVILIFGMSHVIVQMFTGIAESGSFGEATGRVDLIRQITFDARTADTLIFPATDGATGAWSGGGFAGQQVRFRAVNYNPTTQVSTYMFITWESRKSGTAPATDTFEVLRWTLADTNNDRIENDGAFTRSFTEHHIEIFNVRRISRRNFTLEMQTTEEGEKAHVQLSVTLRNAQ
jgi:prepilin-type N-terminal cleavage/methylation domain-containing protein